MSKKIYTPDEIKNLTTSIEHIEDSPVLTDEFGNEINIEETIELADKQVDEIQTISVHFRWSKTEIQRCKKLATKKGLKYQTYIKSILKQAMDKDDVA